MYLVAHYAEGSLMPILIQSIIFDHIPKNAPFWIRPILNRVFAQLNKLLVEPEIKKHVTMVCLTFFDGLGRFLISLMPFQ